MGISRRVVEITAPGSATVVTETIGMPGEGEVLVTSEWGAVSPGSEGLVFRGEVPPDLTLDDSIESLGDSSASLTDSSASLTDSSASLGDSSAALDDPIASPGGVHYPLRYGYTCAGRVSHCGSGVDATQWLGRRVFAFHPHATHLVAPVGDLIPIPDSIDTEVAPLYANAETAVTLVWDAAIAHGEAVLVLGQGIVGMLVAAIAARSGAGLVVSLEPNKDRREQAIAFLQDTPTVVCGSENEVDATINGYAGRYRGRYEGFDAVFELTGNPKTIDTAIERTAFGGRVVLGSWYGTKREPISLGGRFHRGRIQLVSSQVSTIPVAFAGRFSRERRGAITWNTLVSLPTDRLARQTIGLVDVPELLAHLPGHGPAASHDETASHAPAASHDEAAVHGPAASHDEAAPTRPAPWISIDYQKEP